MKRINTITGIFLLAMFIYSCSGSGTSAEETSDEGEEQATEEETANASVYFISPSDGDTVASPLVIEMGVEGMAVDPAGEIKEGMGHHHLIINGSYIQEGTVVPTDSVHIHYGKGQTVDTVDLVPGNYSLTLQFADGVHQSYGQPLSSTINIVVKDNE